MFMHIRQTATYRDGSTRQAEQDQELQLPQPGLDWKACPLGFLLLRDVLLRIAPLRSWALDDPEDAFKGVTARFIGDYLCDHERCPRSMEFFAWLDEHPTQGALLPTQEESWRAKLSFLASDN